MHSFVFHIYLKKPWCFAGWPNEFLKLNAATGGPSPIQRKKFFYVLDSFRNPLCKSVQPSVCNVRFHYSCTTQYYESSSFEWQASSIGNGLEFYKVSEEPACRSLHHGVICHMTSTMNTQVKKFAHSVTTISTIARLISILFPTTFVRNIFRSDTYLARTARHACRKTVTGRRLRAHSCSNWRANPLIVEMCQRNGDAFS